MQKTRLFYYNYLIVLATFLIGCNSHPNEQNVFINDELKPNSIYLNQFIYRPSDMVISGENLIIHDKYEKSFFKIFSLKNFANSTSWGAQGDGPDKIQYVSYNSLSKTKKGFGFVDKYTFRDFEIKSDMEIIEQPQINLSKNLGIFNGFTKLKDDLFIVNAPESKNEDFEHIFIKPNEIVGSKFGSFPKQDDEFDNFENRERYFSKFALVNEFEENIFVFYYKQNLFKIYDYNGLLLKQIELDFEEIQEKDEKALAFMAGAANSDYIFIINPNIIQRELKNNPENYHPNLLVINWDGQLIAKLKIQEPLEIISVSEDNFVYGMTSDIGDTLFYYNVNSILN